MRTLLVVNGHPLVELLLTILHRQFEIEQSSVGILQKLYVSAMELLSYLYDDVACIMRESHVREIHKVEMYLESLRETGDLDKDGGVSYVVTPQAIQTVEDRRREERATRVNHQLRLTMAAPTAALLLVSATESGLISSVREFVRSLRISPVP